LYCLFFRLHISLTLGSISLCLHYIVGDLSRLTIDPDKLAKGIQSYVNEDPEGTGLNAIFDFMARYVRKLHSDRYIRKMLAANLGQSFLNLIGPSDVAYVICLLKNSIKVGRHKMAPPTADALPKPLFTRGEHMKREFGKTAWRRWDEVLQGYFEGMEEDVQPQS